MRVKEDKILVNKIFKNSTEKLKFIKKLVKSIYLIKKTYCVNSELRNLDL